MREIKFRAWDKTTKQMFGGLSVIGFPKVLPFRPNEYFYWVGEEPIEAPRGQLPHHNYIPQKGIIMQYTGLEDKNGKEIYEGDILLGRFKLDDVEDYIYLSLTKKEKETQSKIFIVEDIFFPYINQIPEDLEVIGNTYEGLLHSYENKDIIDLCQKELKDIQKDILQRKKQDGK